MTQTAQIVGTVEFRTGDGPKMPIPAGPVEVETNSTEATLSWTDGDTRSAATMPITDYRRYVSEGAIRTGTPRPVGSSA